MTPGRLRIRFRLFWLTGVRNLMAHRLRVVLSAVGIAAGVALAVGVGAISSSIDASVRNVSQAAAAFANVEIRPPADVGMPAEILEEVRATEGVLEAGATIESFTFMRTADHEVRALVLGVDSGIASMAPREGDVQVFEDGNPLGLYLSPLLSTELGIHSAGEVEVNTTAGWQPLPIAGLLPDDGPVTRAAIGPIGTLKALSKQDGRVDAIYVRANDPGAVIQRLEESLGDRTMIGVPGFTSSIARQLVAVVTDLLGGTALLALFVGAFLVYNTMAMAAAARRREAGLLRALGAGRAQLFRYFCAEGAILGAIGSAAGIGLGVVLARVLFVRQDAALADIFPVELDQLVLRPRDIVVVALVGITAAVLASVLPARRTARIDPVVALRPVGALEGPAERHRLPVLAVGGGLAAAGLLLTEVAPSTGWFLGAILLALAGFTILLRVLVPLGTSLVARGGTLAGALLPRTVHFATGSVQRAPARTTFTAGAIVLALSLVVALPIAISSFSSSARAWMNERLTQDLLVNSASLGVLETDVRLDIALAERLEQLPGVEAVDHFRSVTGSIDGRLVVFQGGHNPTEGDSFPELRGSPGDVVASLPALRTFELDVGDTLQLATPAGTRTVRVVGVEVAPDSFFPQFRFGAEGFEQAWGDVGADSFGLYLSPGADPVEVKAEVLAQFGDDFGITAETKEEFSENAIGFLDALSDLGSSVSALAVVIAALGMANTLLISTLERRHEIGVLRAVGMMRRQAVGLVTAEALIVAVVGIVIAWILGTGLGLSIRASLQGESGMIMPMVFPPSGYLTAALLGVIAALGAALFPARRAARAEISEAIQYE